MPSKQRSTKSTSHPPTLSHIQSASTEGYNGKKGGTIYQTICESGGDVVELRRALIVSMEARPSWTFFVDNDGSLRPTHGVCQVTSKVVETQKVANQLTHMMSREGAARMKDVSFNWLNTEVERMDGVNNARLSNSVVTQLRYLQELYNDPSELSVFRREVADLIGEKNLHGLHAVRPDGAERQDSEEIVNAILFYPSSHSKLATVIVTSLGVAAVGLVALIWFYNNGKSETFKTWVDKFHLNKWIVGPFNQAYAGVRAVFSTWKDKVVSTANDLPYKLGMKERTYKYTYRSKRRPNPNIAKPHTPTYTPYADTDYKPPYPNHHTTRAPKATGRDWKGTTKAALSTAGAGVLGLYGAKLLENAMQTLI